MQLPDFSTFDRTALVTGAARGIGLAMAEALAAGGTTVGIQDIDSAVAKEAADRINQSGGRAFAFGGDLSDPAMPDTLAADAVRVMGRVDILINNGSIQSQVNFPDQDINRVRTEFEANIVAPMRLCQLLIPPMAERKWGRVINLGSIQGIRGNAHMAAYAVSRAAMTNLTIGLAKKYGKEGVTVNCVAPGWYDTYRNEADLKDEQTKRDRGKWLPLGRLGEPEDCAGICVLLCSRAGEYITGQTLYVDGGMSV